MLESFKRGDSLTGVWTGIVLAFILFFLMFSPATSGQFNFWMTMSVTAIILSSIALFCNNDLLPSRIEFSVKSLLWGIAIAVALWFLFWIGDRLSALMFDFSNAQVDSIYDMKEGTNRYLIVALLLCIIGPAEEIFWRGFVQNRLSVRYGANAGFLLSLLFYASVHICSLNFMLIMAALVAGFCWGAIYRFFPKSLPALIVSHALWDVSAFILFPIH